MDETLDALAAKADVKTRAKEWASDTKDSVVEAAQDAATRVRERVPDAEQVGEASASAVDAARRNSRGIALGAAVAGLLVALLILSSRRRTRTRR